jgi:peptidoglycan hydrolase CwlO-like protein
MLDKKLNISDEEMEMLTKEIKERKKEIKKLMDEIEARMDYLDRACAMSRIGNNYGVENVTVPRYMYRPVTKPS